MSPSSKIASLATLLLASSSVDALSLKRTYAGSNFFDGFKFMADNDPTKGFVDYLPRNEAESRGLVKVQGNQVRIQADSTTSYNINDKGRASIRLESFDTFDNGLLLADIAHMPGSACGIWPAFFLASWTFNFDENPYGEIDILEGAMFQDGNAVTLWTSEQCRFTNIGSKEERNNCNINADPPRGCGSMGPSNSYGTPFNNVGGGVYAMYLQDKRVRVWFFPSAQVPADVRCDSPNPDGWGAPISDFQTKNGGCDVAKTFHTQSIIINTDFCGSGVDQDWWDNNAECVRVAPTCNEYVAKNPAAFTEAYWLINSIKLFQ
ncbi:Hyaluronidase [Apiospora hydei]|uniref:Hyaluronidase n=1 Tax=Apiospora hydei TaxID=1337664 RepID=A0ABR1V3J0_9PEZI